MRPLLFYDLGLGETSWKEIIVRNAKLGNFTNSDATVLGSKIIFFGSHDCFYSFILEKESAAFSATQFVQPFEYDKEGDCSFCTHDNKLYAFPKSNYSKVYQFSQKNRKWELFYEKQ